MPFIKISNYYLTLKGGISQFNTPLFGMFYFFDASKCQMTQIKYLPFRLAFLVFFLVDGQIMRNCYNKNDEFPLSSLNGQINSSSGIMNDNQQSTRDKALHNYAKNYLNCIYKSLQKN